MHDPLGPNTGALEVDSQQYWLPSLAVIAPALSAHGLRGVEKPGTAAVSSGPTEHAEVTSSAVTHVISEVMV